MTSRKFVVAACATVLLNVAGACAAGNSVFITEFCSDTGNNEHFEFVEFTNVGPTSVDMTGWSEDDSHATANQPDHSLTGLGILHAGQSGIFTEATPAAFAAFWGSSLPAGVNIVGPYTNDNLSTTSDSITLFNKSGTLVDRLDYSTTNGGSADSVTRNCPLYALGLNNNSDWINSTIGDAFGSFHAAQQFAIIGNPGYYTLVPEPSSAALILVAGGALLTRRRRRGNGADVAAASDLK